MLFSLKPPRLDQPAADVLMYLLRSPISIAGSMWSVLRTLLGATTNADLELEDDMTLVEVHRQSVQASSNIVRQQAAADLSATLAHVRKGAGMEQA